MPNYACSTLRIANPFDPDAEAADFKRAQATLTALRGGIETQTRRIGKLTVTDTSLDFNAVLPMPEALRNTVSPMKVVDTIEEAQKITAERRDQFGQDDDTRTYAIDRETAAAWRREYGHIDWYDWAVHNWGTKWSASGVVILRDHVDVTDPHIVPELVLSFDTAWVEPSGVINHLENQGLIVVGGVIYEDGSEFEAIGDTNLFEEYFEVNTEVVEHESGDPVDIDPDDIDYDTHFLNRWISLRDDVNTDSSENTAATTTAAADPAATAEATQKG